MPPVRQNTTSTSTAKAKPYGKLGPPVPKSSAKQATPDIKPSSTTKQGDPKWNRGSIELKSSDDVVFFIQDFYLLAATTTFRVTREMLANAACKNIEFDDRDIETADVRLFIKMAAGGRLQISREQKHLRPLVLFLRKWDCSGLLSSLMVQLRESVLRERDEQAVLYIWALGALVCDIDTCCIALGLNRATWPKVSDARPSSIAYQPNDSMPEGLKWGEPGKWVFNPNTWPLNMWKMGILASYVCALGRAFWDVGATSGLAHTFKSLLS